MPPKPRPLVERVLSRVDVDSVSGCWLWTGSVNNRGYGTLKAAGRGSRTVPVHRAVYEVCVGPTRRHLWRVAGCAHERCVNPDHWTPRAPRQERCQRGHQMNRQNVYLSPDGDQHCRRCRQDRVRRRKLCIRCHRPLSPGRARRFCTQRCAWAASHGRPLGGSPERFGIRPVDYTREGKPRAGGKRRTTSRVPAVVHACPACWEAAKTRRPHRLADGALVCDLDRGDPHREDDGTWLCWRCAWLFDGWARDRVDG